MKRFRNAILFVALAALAAVPSGAGLFDRVAGARQAPPAKIAYAPIPGGEYQLDPAHSVIGFAVRHLEIAWVEGRFKEFDGTIRYDERDVTKSSVEFTAKVESVDTGVAPRDKHLRSADFFEVEKYPEMSFKSTRVERAGGGYVLHGDLTLKGVTKPVALPFTLAGAVKDPWGNTRFGVEARTKLDRRDYNIVFGQALAAGGFDIGHEVNIELHLEAVRPATKPAAGQ
jgi:polyisoprenoid-binding protein YceI